MIYSEFSICCLFTIRTHKLLRCVEILLCLCIEMVFHTLYIDFFAVSKLNIGIHIIAFDVLLAFSSEAHSIIIF